MSAQPAPSSQPEQPAKSSAPKAPAPEKEPAIDGQTVKPTQAPPQGSGGSGSPPAQSVSAAAFVLPPGYDEAEAGLQQNDKDLMAQAMAVLPPTNFDAQAIRVVVAAALGDSEAITRESAQLKGATAPSPSPYSDALADLARSVSGPKLDWTHLDAIADGMNARKGCILVYDALALFAAKAGDKTRSERYRKLAAAHAGEDG